MSRTVTLTINNCKECPHHVVADARRSIDEDKEIALQIEAAIMSGRKLDLWRKKYPLSVFCSKSNNGDYPSREVVTFTPPVRPEKLAAMCEIPEWCPLLNK